MAGLLNLTLCFEIEMKPLLVQMPIFMMGVFFVVFLTNDHIYYKKVGVETPTV